MKRFALGSAALAAGGALSALLLSAVSARKSQAAGEGGWYCGAQTAQQITATLNARCDSSKTVTMWHRADLGRYEFCCAAGGGSSAAAPELPLTN